ncbi:hypothetical protein HAX54_039641, partial [Datura stramonium]|nr:hypothetical protein [Datura stramonium]
TGTPKVKNESTTFIAGRGHLFSVRVEDIFVDNMVRNDDKGGEYIFAVSPKRKKAKSNGVVPRGGKTNTPKSSQLKDEDENEYLHTGTRRTIAQASKMLPILSVRVESTESPSLEFAFRFDEDRDQA